MKRISILWALGLTVLLLGGCANQQGQVDYIGIETAKALALEDCGLTAAGVEFTSAELTSRDGLDYYEVDFTAAGQSYEYDIDALTGTIIETNNPAAETSPAAAGESASGAVITEEEAKAKALEHAGLDSSQVTFVKAKLEWDAGRQVYDVEFYIGDGGEYDYEIDAATGEILSYDYDAVGGTAPAAESPAVTGQAAGGQITEEEAKAKALEHAGLNSSQVTFTKTKLDRENGTQVYDVEFRADDGREYEYEIDAATGEILSYDYDAAGGTASGSSLTADQAKELALAQVPGAAVGDIRDFETDYDDGRMMYEGKIVYGGTEYEFEIDGYSGAICHWETEPAR